MFPPRRPTHSHVAYYIAFPLVGSVLIGLAVWWVLHLRRQGRRRGSKGGADAGDGRPARGAWRVGADRAEGIALQRPASVLVVGEPTFSGVLDASGRRLGTTTTVEAGFR